MRLCRDLEYPLWDFLKNYYLCINEKVVGFTQRTADIGDVIYLSVKYNKKTICGARATISELTDHKPWEDAERYVQCFKVENIEYCTPFNLSILKEYDRKSWGPLFLQRSKLIKQSDVIERLEKEFNRKKLKELYLFENTQVDPFIFFQWLLYISKLYCY